jgi:hypothetical protein
MQARERERGTSFGAGEAAIVLKRLLGRAFMPAVGKSLANLADQLQIAINFSRMNYSRAAEISGIAVRGPR